ncbi:esterase [Kosakonia sp. SOY2]|uniref:esterase n=1 Tax=Kosakonia sp. SOY2 TaxID=3014557 RepID=UPI0022AC81E9|nr:esterase [Kosakonia sp. SOY2]MCZ3384768.1 esterase [Kosakonia sp. SOY2]
MIELQVEQFAGIETLHAFPAGKRGEPLPCVVFYHGFTSSKLVYSYFAVALAQAGFRVVMPDAPDHGARFSGDVERRLHRFWQILRGNIEEFAALRDALERLELIDNRRLAIGGASMGGMTALGIMTQHPEVRCVASLMGSGYFTTLARTLFPPLVVTTPEQQYEFNVIIDPLSQWDVSTQLARIADRPLLLWHGEQDDVVPAAESFRLQQALQEQGLDTNLTYQWEAGVTHRITPQALSATTDFFSRYL